MSSDHGGYLKMRENGGFLQNFLALEAAWRTRFKFELLLLSSLLIQFLLYFFNFRKSRKWPNFMIAKTEIYQVLFPFFAQLRSQF